MPLMTRTIENGFELTGPIARGDWDTVDAHVRAIHDARPGARADVPRAGGGDEAVKVVRTVAEMRAALAERATVGLVPTMGALHAGHVSLLEAARAECDCVVMSLFVNEAQFGPARTSRAIPATRSATRASPKTRASTSSSRPRRTSSSRPASAPGSSRTRRALEAEFRPGHFRGVATVCLKLFNIVRPDARVLRPEGRAAGPRRPAHDPRPELDVELRVLPTVRDADGLALSSRNALLTPEERDARAERSPARCRQATPLARASCSTVSTSTTSRSPTSSRGARRRRADRLHTT